MQKFRSPILMKKASSKTNYERWCNASIGGCYTEALRHLLIVLLHPATYTSPDTLTNACLTTTLNFFCRCSKGIFSRFRDVELFSIPFCIVQITICRLRLGLEVLGFWELFIPTHHNFTHYFRYSTKNSALRDFVLFAAISEFFAGLLFLVWLVHERRNASVSANNWWLAWRIEFLCCLHCIFLII